MDKPSDVYDDIAAENRASEPDALAEAYRTAAMPPTQNPPHGTPDKAITDIISVLSKPNPSECDYDTALQGIRTLKDDTRNWIRRLSAIESVCDDAEEKKNSIGAVAVFDCTWPSHWPKDQIPVKASFNTVYPQEIRDRVLANWSEYGL